MSNSSPFARRSSSLPTVPRGDVLGEYESYLEAQKVVDRLAKAEFAVSGMAIVGSDLKTVERITGRLSYGRAALAGAASGTWIGLFFGLILFLFSPAPEFSFVLAAGFIGAGFGMILGIVSYSIGRRRRDFSSTHQVLASRYQLIIDPNQTARARQVLAGGAVWPPPLPVQPHAGAGPISGPDSGPSPASGPVSSAPASTSPVSIAPVSTAPVATAPVSTAPASTEPEAGADDAPAPQEPAAKR